MFEELGGDPTGISLIKRNVGSVCAHVNEWQPVMKNIDAYGRLELPQRPKAHLMCAPGQKISSIKFASFGTPQGVCGSFQEGNCHAHKSYDAFEKVWLLSLSPSASTCVIVLLEHIAMSLDFNSKACLFHVIKYIGISKTFISKSGSN